uniref:Uncharacterized protein n=1 Tax=Rhizophora mucronata TaxID=61149 RepID=A0A2P2KK89_RHIMU
MQVNVQIPFHTLFLHLYHSLFVSKVLLASCKIPLPLQFTQFSPMFCLNLFIG